MNSYLTLKFESLSACSDVGVCVGPFESVTRSCEVSGLRGRCQGRSTRVTGVMPLIKELEMSRCSQRCLGCCASQQSSLPVLSVIGETVLDAHLTQPCMSMPLISLPVSLIKDCMVAGAGPADSSPTQPPCARSGSEGSCLRRMTPCVSWGC